MRNPIGITATRLAITAADAREAEQLMLREFPGVQAAAIPVEEMAGTTPAMALWDWLLTQP